MVIIMTLRYEGEDTRSIYGFNYRMTDIQAVIAEQLKKLNYIILKIKKDIICLKNIYQKNSYPIIFQKIAILFLIHLFL